MNRTINNYIRGSLANCIALHDLVRSEISFKSLFEYLVTFFQRHEVYPTRISGPTNSTKTTSFERGKKQYENRNFEGVKHFWMGATPPHHNNDTFDSIFSTQFTLDSQCTTFVLCFDNNIIKFDSNFFNKTIKELSVFLSPQYGYSYQREFKFGPDGYPFGMITGYDWKHPESKKITEWAKEFHREDGIYRTGDMRDIYPCNILSNAHQNLVFQGKPFFEWISSDPKHGRLDVLGPDLWAWWVEHEHIPMIRETLRPTGWLLAI